MIDQEQFESLLPKAYEWAKAQEDFVLHYGAPLSPSLLDDARRAGVQESGRIRVLVVDRIPLPEKGGLAEAAKTSGILNHNTRCVSFGHAIIIRADSWGDRELLVHNLVHVAQCERAGGLKAWITHYLGDRRNCPQFSIGSLEEDARSLARQICQTQAVA